ncbi:MAG: tetratricopeptide repeat protein [Phycisphaerales bacterium]|nr:tetratricopeptide repeat protein [Phycisphaerales bacterium]
MKMKPKTARRLLLLGVLAFLAIAATVGLFGVRTWQKSRIAKGYLAEGLAAVEGGDLATARSKLARYVRVRPTDKDAWLKLAHVLESLEENNASHIFAAIKGYQQYLDLEPNDREAALALVGHYNSVGFFQEARDLASDFLPGSPADMTVADVPFLREEITARAALMENTPNAEPDPDLAALAKRIIELVPDDFYAQSAYTSWLRESSGIPEAAKHAGEVAAKHPDDVRFTWLAAMVAMDGSPAAGRAAYNTVCSIVGLEPRTAQRISQPAYTDPGFVVRVVGAFDAMGRYEHALAVLEDAAARIKDGDMERVYLRRAWQVGRGAEVAERVLKSDLKGAHSDSFAFAVLSLNDQGRRAEAAPLVDELKSRTTDFRARAWAAALEPALSLTPANALATVDALRAAEKLNQREPVIKVYLGDAYSLLDRNEEAREAWGQAAKSSFSAGWALPHVRISSSLLKDKRPEEAFRAAQLALRVSPNSIASNIAVLTSQVAMLEAGYDLPDEPAVLSDAFEQLATHVASMPSSTGTAALADSLLPGRVLLAARANNPELAQRVITDALARAPRPRSDVLRHLAVISDSAKLGLAEQCLAAAEIESGSNPDSVLTRALLLHTKGDTTGGKQLLHEAAASASPEQALVWSLAMAHYLDSSGDPGAKANWAALTDAHPEHLQMQLAALRSRSAASDLAFIEKLSERVARLTGADPTKPTTLSRIARARALLATPSPKGRDEAIKLLVAISIESEGLLDARSLLIRAYLMDDPAQGISPNIPAALEQLRSAAAIAPNKAPYQLEIGRILHLQRDFEKARSELLTVANDTSAEFPVRGQAIELLIAQRDAEAAVGPLEQMVGAHGETVQPDLLVRLAAVYTDLGKAGLALDVLHRLAAMKIDDPSMLFRIADALAFHDDSEGSAQMLASIDSLSLPPGAAEIYHARFAERRNDDAGALAHYTAATQANPKLAETWSRLARFYLNRKQYEQAARTISLGLQQLPADPELLVVQEQVHIASSPGDDANLTALADLLATNPATASRAAALRAVQEAKTAGKFEDPATLLALASRFPNELAVQMLVVRQLYRLKPPRLDDAAALVSRSLAAFPTEPEPARLAVAIFQSRGEYQAMLGAAEAWQELTHSLESALAVAESQLTLNQPRQAIETLRPYLETARQSPSDPESMITLGLQARALILDGKAREAHTILSPLLSQHRPLITQVWLPLAAAIVPEQRDARAWVELAQQLLASPSTEEKIALGGSWHALAKRFPEDRSELLTWAIEILRPLAEQNPPPLAALHALGSSLQLAGDHAGAIAVLRKAVALSPDSEGSWLLLASFQVESKLELDDAIASAQKAEELVPGPNTVALGVLASAHEAKAAELRPQSPALANAESQKSIDAYRQILAIQPQNLQAIWKLAQFAEARVDFPAVIEMYERLLLIPSAATSFDLAAIQNNLAYAILMNSKGSADLDRARQLVQSALDRAPSPSFLDTLGMIEAARKDRPAAIDAFRRALAANPQLASSYVQLLGLLASGNDSQKAEARQMLSGLALKIGSEQDLPEDQRQILQSARESLAR